MKIQGYEMRAVAEPLVLAEREQGHPPAGQVLIEVAGCGVCHTDLGFLYQGVPTRHPLPLVLGHEAAGRVIEEGPGVSGLLGRQVIVPAVMPCGACELCRQGLGEICRAQVFPGNDVHGGFASHLVVPAAGLCPVPRGEVEQDGLAALSVCADAVSTAYQALLKSGVGPRDFVIFVGAGGVGSFGVQIARALGAVVLAIDVDPERLARLEHYGAAWTLDARAWSSRDLKKRVRDLAKEAGLAATGWKIFETSGTAAGQETAFSLLTFGATLGVVGFHPGDVSIRLSNLMAFSARAIGTWGCLPEHFPAVLELVLAGRIELEPFIERHPMSRIQAVFERLRRHELKRRPVLIPDF
jgi:6-hydroxycyclohex-1-ene-1-carbonyl-CoA dehydrogenase